MNARLTGALLGLLASGCVGSVSDLPVTVDAGAPVDAGTPGDAGNTATDAGSATPDAGTTSPEAGEAADAGEADAGSDAGTAVADAGTALTDAGVLVDGGWYPGLPTSCQGLINHTHGTCADAYANPNYGSVQWDFRGDVDQAIADVGQPAGYFNGGEVLPTRRSDYAALVAAQLDAAGLCAVWNGSELYVRDRARDLNETFSLFTSAGRPRAGGHYQCARSDELPGTQPAYTCALPPSTSGSCGNSGQNLFTEVVSLVEEVIQEEQLKGASSQVIDFAFKSLHVRGWRLKDDGYPFVSAVARKANARGACVQSNGWKGLELKLVNALSEQYSLVTHVSLPDPATQPALYAACVADGILPSCEFIIEKGEETCRPASF